MAPRDWSDGLLERSELVTELVTLADGVRTGVGAMVLLTGEAGIGKTSVVRALLGRLGGGTRVWEGACDPWGTPTPLGPLVDIGSGDQRVRTLLETRSAHEIAPSVLRLLDMPTVVTFEDVHWMDDATSDLLIHLARRIDRTRALVVVTHRDGRENQSGALTRFLGAVGTSPGVRRRRVHPLTRTAVATLAAGTGVDPAQLHRRTGGNPFFVTELLAAGTETVPTTISAVVLSRADTMSEAGRRLADLVSLAPDGLEFKMAEQILGGETGRTALDEVTSLGLVSVETGRLEFRHELARLAVAEAVPPSRRMQLHRQIMALLEQREGVEPSRLAHHAAEIGDSERLYRHALAAARAAYRRGAYHVVLTHLEAILAQGGPLTATERAEVLGLMADSKELVDAPEVAVTARARAADAWRDAGDPKRQARQLAGMFHLLHRTGDIAAAQEAVARAVRLVDGLPVDEEVSYVVSMNLTCLAMFGTTSVAREAAERAAADLEAAGAPRSLCKVLMWRGSLRVRDADVEGGVADALRAVEIGRGEAPHLAVEPAMNVAETLIEWRRPEEAMRLLDRVLPDARELKDPDYLAYVLASRARVFLMRGEFEQARMQASSEEARTTDLPPELVRNAVLAGCLTRIGDAAAPAAVARAADLLGDMGDLAFAWPVAAVRAEAAWLAGNGAAIGPVTEPALALACETRHPWAAGELLHWRRRAGLDGGSSLDWVADPWVLMIGGGWRDAADAWESLSAPYEQALALAGGDVAARVRALEILTALGAVPLADRVRADLRRAGVDHLPARPRTHGLDLTVRQQEVLALVADGLTNEQIGNRLHISTKTAGNHVSAILERLGVSSRAEAVTVAIRNGLLDSTH